MSVAAKSVKKWLRSAVHGAQYLFTRKTSVESREAGARNTNKLRRGNQHGKITLGTSTSDKVIEAKGATWLMEKRHARKR